jgi:hypothetical protein
LQHDTYEERRAVSQAEQARSKTRRRGGAQERASGGRESEPDLRSLGAG